MKVLTKEDIKRYGKQLIDPFGGDPCLTPVGYDIRVGEEVSFITSGQKKTLRKGDYVEIPPWERFAVKSLEKVKMPKDMFALIATRIGLLWEGLTSLGTKIDPLFQDELMLIFSNDSDVPLRLDYEQRICNIMFFEYENPPEDLEIRKRPSFSPPPRLESIEGPLKIEEVRKKHGSAIASVIQYLRPRIVDHEKRLKGLERFRTATTSIVIGALSTFVVSLVFWFLTR